MSDGNPGIFTWLNEGSSCKTKIELGTEAHACNPSYVRVIRRIAV
jgi:hypothetical protein